MTIMTIDRITEWASENKLIARTENLLSLGYRTPAPSHSVGLLTNSQRTPADLVLLANRLVWVSSEEGDPELSAEDRRYIFWVRESGIWPDLTEAIASEAFLCLLGRKEQAAASGALLEATESSLAVLLTLNTILFRWDAYLIPVSAKFISHISHDGYIEIWARSEVTLNTVLRRLEAFGARLR